MSDDPEISDLGNYHLGLTLAGGHSAIIFTAVAMTSSSCAVVIALLISSISLPLVVIAHVVKGDDPRANVRLPVMSLCGVGLAVSVGLVIWSASVWASILYFAAGIVFGSYMFNLPGEVGREIKKRSAPD